MIETTQEAVVVALTLDEEAALKRTASDTADQIWEMGGDADAFRTLYIRQEIILARQERIAAWMDATRQTVEGFIGQIKDNPMFSLMGGGPFGG